MQGSVTYQYLQDNDMAIIRKSGFQQMLAQMDVIEQKNLKLCAALQEIATITTDPEFGTPTIETAIKIANAALVENKDD